MCGNGGGGGSGGGGGGGGRIFSRLIIDIHFHCFGEFVGRISTPFFYMLTSKMCLFYI